jgi:hypothetical protein
MVRSIVQVEYSTGGPNHGTSSPRCESTWIEGRTKWSQLISRCTYEPHIRGRTHQAVVELLSPGHEVWHVGGECELHVLICRSSANSKTAGLNRAGPGQDQKSSLATPWLCDRCLSSQQCCMEGDQKNQVYMVLHLLLPHHVSSICHLEAQPNPMTEHCHSVSIGRPPSTMLEVNPPD